VGRVVREILEREKLCKPIHKAKTKPGRAETQRYIKIYIQRKRKGRRGLRAGFTYDEQGADQAIRAVVFGLPFPAFTVQEVDDCGEEGGT